MSGKTGSTYTYDIGMQAETIAMEYLIAQGYVILEQRYKTQYGEIDLIVEKHDFLCFVEVKLRQTFEKALESVSARSRKRIENAALHYMGEHPCKQDKYMRFDVIGVTHGMEITHLDNAWQSQA